MLSISVFLEVWLSYTAQIQRYSLPSTSRTFAASFCIENGFWIVMDYVQHFISLNAVGFDFSTSAVAALRPASQQSSLENSGSLIRSSPGKDQRISRDKITFSKIQNIPFVPFLCIQDKYRD